MIITDKAKEKIRQIADEEGIGHTSIRVRVLPGGCSGFTFDMEFDDRAGELDETLLIEDIQVIIDPLSFQYMEEMTIDFEITVLEAGFRFSGGESTKCACGNSVGFDTPAETANETKPNEETK